MEGEPQEELPVQLPQMQPVPCRLGGHSRALEEGLLLQGVYLVAVILAQAELVQAAAQMERVPASECSPPTVPS